MPGRDPKATATVFTSSGGDGDTLHDILEAWLRPQMRSLADAVSQLRPQRAFRLLEHRHRLVRTDIEPLHS